MNANYRCIALVALCLAACASQALSKPPKVAKAVPDNGDTDVDPTLKEIRITFDQPMSTGGQSIVGGGESFPELVGNNPGSWAGSRTFILRVRLKPNHQYWLSVNSDKFQNFKNRQGEPAVPYPIQFSTSNATSAKAARPAASAADNRSAVDQLKQALATRYSYRDRVGVDWPSKLEARRQELESATDARSFAQVAATLLAPAQDKHLWFLVGEERIPSYVHPVTPNANFAQLPKVVPHWKQHSQVLASGHWDDGIGYVLIATWDRGKTRELAPVFEVLEEFRDAPGLIIDVRANGGGDERLAQSVAGCFVEKPTVYAKHVLVDPDSPGGFSEPYERVVEPNKRRAHYGGRIAVLTGPVIMSSCEAFLLMMKQVPGAVLVGAASQGSSGNPQPVELENGVTAYLPSWKTMTADGTEFEGRGIPPDIRVDADPEDFSKIDPIIESALAHLRSKP